jgi:uncharacterized membrane protein
LSDPKKEEVPETDSFNVSRASNPIDVAKHLIDNIQKGRPTNVNFVDVAGDKEVEKGVEETQKQAKRMGKMVGISEIFAALLLIFPVVTSVIALINTSNTVAHTAWEGNFFEYFKTVSTLFFSRFFVVLAASSLISLLVLVVCYILFVIVSSLFEKIVTHLVRAAQKRQAKDQQKKVAKERDPITKK